MKSFTAEIAHTVRSRRGRQNLKALGRFLLVLAGMIAVYSVTFHILMEREGQSHTWITGFYWTLTVMSTLGFGDITFHTDLGRLFSIVVLLSGMIFLLVLLPFTFIEFFYEPWLQSQAAARAPRELPADTRNHVLLTHDDPVTRALIKRLGQHRYPHALIVPDIEEALRLHDEDIKVVVGHLDDPETWRRVRLDQAALVAATGNDFSNTNVAFTVRGLDEKIRIISTASDEASVDVLELAGSNMVLQLGEVLGQAFARRVIGGDALAHVIGRFDDVLIAEATTHRTPLVGKTLREAEVLRHVGVTVAGLWERGSFQPARADSLIQDRTILVVAGSQEALDRYNEFFCIYNVSAQPVVILGGGRVGRATGRALRQRGIDHRIVDILPDRIRDPERYVLGNAADLGVLQKAGIDQAPTVVITPRDDDLNVYLTIYCRQLRPDIQIISRATLERNIPTLHRAGADMVMSYASLGASSILNLLRHGSLLMVAEGLDLFRVDVPEALANRKLAESGLRSRTGCSVVAIAAPDGKKIVPGPDETLQRGAELVLIGSIDAESRFLELYGESTRKGER